MDKRKRSVKTYRYIGADTTAFNAQMWATGMLAFLEEEIVVSNIFNRDFDTAFASKGDTVNARRLGKFNGDRLESGGTLQTETADATNVVVSLDQHITSAFTILDRDNHKSFQELVPIYIVPAARAMIEQIDLICQGEKYQFWQNQVATSAGLTYDSAVDTGKVLTENLAARDGRWLLGGAGFEADTLKTDKFTTFDNTGDGSPLINGRLARGAGFTLGMSQMFNETSDDTFATTTAVVNGAVLKGATVITVDADTLAAGALAGTFLKTAAGNIHRVVSDDLSSNAGDYTITPALFGALADNETLTFYTSDTLDGALAVGHTDWIVYDATTGFGTREPEVGDGIAFGNSTATDVYGILKIDAANDKVKLNRPIDTAVADGVLVCPFPAGNYNLAMVPGAATIVVRSMSLPLAGSGVSSAVANDNGWALRAVQSYDHDTFKSKFSFDTLVGVKTTNTSQGALLITN